MYSERSVQPERHWKHNIGDNDAWSKCPSGIRSQNRDEHERTWSSEQTEEAGDFLRVLPIQYRDLFDIDRLIVHGDRGRVERPANTVECYTEQALSLYILKQFILWDSETDVEVPWYGVVSTEFDKIGAVEEVRAEGFCVVLPCRLESIGGVDYQVNEWAEKEGEGEICVSGK